MEDFVLKSSGELVMAGGPSSDFHSYWLTVYICISIFLLGRGQKMTRINVDFTNLLNQVVSLKVLAIPAMTTHHIQ